VNRSGLSEAGHTGVGERDHDATIEAERRPEVRLSPYCAAS
jgi:hypothetical protein